MEVMPDVPECKAVHHCLEVQERAIARADKTVPERRVIARPSLDDQASKTCIPSCEQVRKRGSVERDRASEQLQQVVNHDGLLTRGPHPDAGDPGATELLEPVDVSLGVLGQIFELPALADVFAPAVEFLIDRYRMVEVALRRRHDVVPLAVDLVA